MDPITALIICSVVLSLTTGVTGYALGQQHSDSRLGRQIGRLQSEIYRSQYALYQSQAEHRKVKRAIDEMADALPPHKANAKSAPKTTARHHADSSSHDGGAA